MDALALKLTTAVRLVVIEDENGTQTEWELREMKAAARDTYLTQFAARCRVNEQGEVTSLTNFDGMQAALLTRTLFKKSDGVPVKESEVQKWPSSAVTQLFVAAQEINLLLKKKEGEEAPKND
jgi:hypothetical protein